MCMHISYERCKVFKKYYADIVIILPAYFYQTFNQLMESSSKSLYERFRKEYFFIEACHEIYDKSIKYSIIA